MLVASSTSGRNVGVFLAFVFFLSCHDDDDARDDAYDDVYDQARFVSDLATDFFYSACLKV